SSRAASGGVVPLALFVACALLYSITLGRMAHPDEYYHILAAHNLLTTGEPRIAEGIYTRVYLHTWLVAQSFALFGESLAASRVPSLLATAALVAVMFVWLRREAGNLAAWIGAGLFAISPFAVDIAQFCRFYALQALAMFVTAITVHAGIRALRESPLRGLALLAVSSVPLAFAVYLQPTSLLGCVGLGLWAVGTVGLPWLGDPQVPSRRKLLAIAGIVLAGVLVLAAAIATGIAAELWRQYTWAPYFNQRATDQFWFYHQWYSLLYPSLWPITGFLALLAITLAPLPASMAVVVFAVGFLLNSFAASKSLRYIAYAQPFLFVIWGIGVAALWPHLLAFTQRLRGTLAEQIERNGGPRRTAGVLLVGAILFLGVANAATVRSIALLADITIPPEQSRTNWPAARAELEPWLERADVVVSTEELGHLYFLGRYDVRFSPSKMDELPPGEQHEFGRDHRTGRPVIGTAESIQRILECYPTGIIVGPSAHWGRPELINDELSTLIAEHAQPLPLPRRSQLSAYVWEHAPPAADDARCQGLPTFRRGNSDAG
ncbi:MAG: ArnT family glycosyltransferase, partial [Geminicoccaceae bacterium]